MCFGRLLVVKYLVMWEKSSLYYSGENSSDSDNSGEEWVVLNSLRARYPIPQLKVMLLPRKESRIFGDCFVSCKQM